MSSRARLLALLAGPLAALVLGLAARAAGLGAPAAWTAAVTGLCAAWWIFEPIPIPATSLVPFAAFPLTGVLDHAKVANAYGDTLILLLLGGFVLSKAMEKSGAHRRLAVGMVKLVGGKNRRRLVLGFMLATGVISMWISNSATTLMMLPVAMAVLEQDDDGELAVPLLLGIAYSASIGGIGTPVGTPPNVIFMGAYRATTGREVTFLEWMKIGVPVVLVMLPAAWWLLTRRLGRSRPLEVPSPGEWRPAERRVLVVFACTALAWITRSEPWGGWTGLFGMTGVSDSTVALVATISLFLIPDGEGGQMLDWPTASRIPWGLLLLFGGGIAIAMAFEQSGLSVALGSSLGRLATLPVLVTMLLICLVVTFLTEVTSNTATATLLMPVLAAAALGAKIEPALLMIPAAISASCAFMLPVATAPNAIVFGTDQVGSGRMAREGVALNLIGVPVIAVLCAVLLGR